jgi:arylsulfatase A-like enzyme
VDVAPTLLSAVGIEPHEAMEGHSLLPLLDDPRARLRDFVVSQECTWQAKWAFRDDTHKLILARKPDFHHMPPRELYDLRADPDELRNVVDEHPELASDLEARLEGWIAEGMAKNGLTEDPVAAHGISLGKAWEDWIARGKPGEG